MEEIRQAKVTDNKDIKAQSGKKELSLNANTVKK